MTSAHSEILGAGSDWAELEVEVWEDGSSGGTGILRARGSVPLKDSFWRDHAREELSLPLHPAAGPQVSTHLTLGPYGISSTPHHLCRSLMNTSLGQDGVLTDL